MSSHSDSAIPPWLQVSHSNSHLRTALTTLAKREIRRERARAASRHRSDPSRVHRVTHIGTPLLPRNEYIENYSISVGYQPQNQWGNRYIQIEPYDRTRVIVGEGPSTDMDGRGEGRYINGSWVRESYGGKWWIATQAPLPDTVHAFLSLILQPVTSPPPSLLSQTPTTRTTRIRTVVQLTPNFESGRQKAHVYFPTGVGQSWVVPPEPGCSAPSIKVTLLDSQSISGANCIQSTVSIAPASQLDSEPIIFRHMLYHAWPDHSIPGPEDRPTLAAFVRLVDRTNRDTLIYRATDLDPDPPIIVGCSAGIGRTGSFITLSSLFRAHNLMSHSAPISHIIFPAPYQPALPPSPLGPLPESLKRDLVAQEIDFLREQRPGMVQREEQILLIYEVLADAFLELG